MIVTRDTTRSKIVAPCDIRRSDLRRRHPGPPRPQRPSYRAGRREPAPRPRKALKNGLTKDHVGGRNPLGQQARRPGRDHLVTGGRHHPGIPGRNHPVLDGRLRRNRQPHTPRVNGTLCRGSSFPSSCYPSARRAWLGWERYASRRCIAVWRRRRRGSHLSMARPSSVPMAFPYFRAITVSKLKLSVISGTGFLLGVGLFVAIGQLHVQQSAPAAATLAPTDARRAPDLSNKYRECVLETIKTQQAGAEVDDEAERETWQRAFVGKPIGYMYRMLELMPKPSAADIEMQRQVNFMKIKELCRLKFPCSDGERVSGDYNSCFEK